MPLCPILGEEVEELDYDSLEAEPWVVQEGPRQYSLRSCLREVFRVTLAVQTAEKTNPLASVQRGDPYFALRQRLVGVPWAELR